MVLGKKQLGASQFSFRNPLESAASVINLFYKPEMQICPAKKIILDINCLTGGLALFYKCPPIYLGAIQRLLCNYKKNKTKLCACKIIKSDSTVRSDTTGSVVDTSVRRTSEYKTYWLTCKAQC